MKPSAARLLRVLRDAGSVGLTTGEICQPDAGGIRFGARLQELRREYGCEIETKRIRAGSFRYVLIAGPSDTGVGGGSPSLAAVDSGAAAEIETGSLDQRRPSPESAPAPASGQLFDLEPQSAVLSDHEAA